MKIGLALSGGGFRATGFHLGVLARLAEEKRLEDVTFLSTVSGGSLCIGLIMALNDFCWPTSHEYLEKVAPRAREVMTTLGLQTRLLWRVLHPLRIFGTKADDLSVLLRKHWGVTISLDELPEKPRWMINATCYETGKNWRFERFRMGDYVFGLSTDTQGIPLSDALAASAGFPGLIGPLTFNTRPYSWFKYEDKRGDTREPIDPEDGLNRTKKSVIPKYPKVHLWDGGVYDNHGLEPLHNFNTGWREGVNFLIVSDAAGRSKSEKYLVFKAPLRIVTGIMMDQVRSLRSRAILERLINHREESRGGFLQIGNTCEQVPDAADKDDEIPKLRPDCLEENDCNAAADMDTEIRQLTPDEFRLLFRHGFEVADYTLYTYNEDEFDYVGYRDSRWWEWWES
jgi:NTE family protein